MAIDAEQELRLVGDIYDAALEPGLWPDILARLATLAEAHSAVFMATDLLNPDYNFTFHHNIPDEALRAHREEGLDALEFQVSVPPLVQRGIGTFVTAEEVFGSVEDWFRACGPLYDRCYKPAGIYHAGAVLVDHAEHRWSALGLHRPRDWGPLTRKHALWLERVGRHLRRALHLHRRLTLTRRPHARLYGLMDGASAGILLLDPDGRVRFGNPAAERLLAGHGALALTGNGGLRPGRPSQGQALQSLLQSALRADGRSSGGVMGLRHQTSETPLVLNVMPLSEWRGYDELAKDGVAAVIFLSDPEQRRRLPRQVLRDVYRLTEREADICEAFLHAGSPEGVAAKCGVSPVTVRSYLRDIYGKTGRHSQAELMRLLMGLTVESGQPG